MSVTTLFFWLIASITGICAIGVVVSQNIVRAAAYLLFTLAGVAATFFLLGADFVGATQLIVYVGGILVLVVFGVMLTAQGPFVNIKTGAAEWAIAGVVGLLLFGMLAYSLFNLELTAEKPRRSDEPIAAAQLGEPASGLPTDAARSQTSVQLGEAFLGVTEATPPASLTGLPKGMDRSRTRVGYLLPFEIVSVHLLVVLIGAAYLARAKRRRTQE